MKVIKTKQALRKFIKGKKIGLVPTMGSLHEGHLSLVRKSVKQNPCTIVSIFVNPKQFSPNEDYDSYPRNLQHDLKLLSPTGVDAVFCPSVSNIYGPDENGFHTYVGYRNLEKLYCGKYRPGFFNGVMLVVLKLLHMVEPQRLYLGKKDYQQYFLIKKMAADLNMGVKVIGLPTIRNANGLALSSRNQYLSAKDMATAESINCILKQAKSLVVQGKVTFAPVLKEKIIAALKKEVSIRIQYVEVVNKADLLPATDLHRTVILMAGFVNQVRLIDNIELSS